MSVAISNGPLAATGWRGGQHGEGRWRTSHVSPTVSFQGSETLRHGNDDPGEGWVSAGVSHGHGHRAGEAR
jgi:hypothetical protein